MTDIFATGITIIITQLPLVVAWTAWISGYWRVR